MAQTVISRGDALARKIYSVSLFTEAVKKSTFTQMLVGATASQMQANMKARARGMQSSADMPIVQITDLRAAAGDTVSVDMFGIMTGKPIMGDRKAAGTGQPLKLSSMDISINQHRKVADPGGKMTQKRTVHDLRELSRSNLTDYFGRYIDQQCLVHMAGARGTEDTIDWIVPLESDEDFDEIMVNPVTPPTPNRRFFAGDATSVTQLAATDVLSLDEIDKLRALLNEMPLPPSPCRVPGKDGMIGGDDPLYLLLVTSRQWHYLQITSNARGDNWRSFLAAGLSRQRMNTHPLFTGDTGVWNGILVRQTNRAIRWKPGDNVAELGSDYVTISQNAVPANIHVDRAVLMGGQALGWALGNGGTNFPSRWIEEESDGENAVEIFGTHMFGKAKLRFRGSDKKLTDFGVMTLDTYAPPVDSALGAVLTTSLKS